MAKRCLSGLVVDGVYYPLMQINDFSICTDGWEVRVSSSLPSYVTSLGSNLYEDAFNREWAEIGEPITKYILGDNAFLRVYDYNGTGNGNTFNLQIVGYPSLGFCQEGISYSAQSTAFWHICIVVDDDTELAWAFHYESTGLWKYAPPADETKHLLYEALVETSLSGGAGSGYIGNSLVSNKKMVGYNVPTSSAESTKTESVNDVSASAVSGKPKSGNGFARIKFLREVSGGTLYELAKTRNTDNMQLYVANQWWNDYLSHFTSYLGTNNILQCVRNGSTRIASYNGYTLDTNDKTGMSETEILIPIQHITVSKVTCIGHTSSYTSQYRYGWVYLYKIENNALVRTATLFQVNGGVDATSSIVLDEPVETDYISFYVGDGSATFHDIVFNGD